MQMAEAERLAAIAIAVGTAAFVVLVIAIVFLLFEERVKRFFD